MDWKSLALISKTLEILCLNPEGKQADSNNLECHFKVNLFEIDYSFIRFFLPLTNCYSFNINNKKSSDYIINIDLLNYH